MVFTNGKNKSEKDFKKYLTISYKDIIGYTNTLLGKEKLPWKLDKIDKPDDVRCLKVTYKTGEKPDMIYFCVYYGRSDWERKKKLDKYSANYTVDMWAAMINKRILSFNLKQAQNKMLRSVSSVNCNSHIMEPIKFTFRNHVINLS